jgi:hypothetical protein
MYFAARYAIWRSSFVIVETTPLYIRVRVGVSKLIEHILLQELGVTMYLMFFILVSTFAQAHQRKLWHVSYTWFIVVLLTSESRQHTGKSQKDIIDMFTFLQDYGLWSIGDLQSSGQNQRAGRQQVSLMSQAQFAVSFD